MTVTTTIRPSRAFIEWWEADPDHHLDLGQEMKQARAVLSQLRAEGVILYSDGTSIVIELEAELPEQSQTKLRPLVPSLFALLEMERLNLRAEVQRVSRIA